jgi:SAM-dependent methyltransferase
MVQTAGSLRLYEAPVGRPVPPRDPALLATRELLRPFNHRHGRHRLEPLSAEWFDAIEHKRFSRHGKWLNSALEFGRHPGESVLLLYPGLGSDAIRFIQHGTEVVLGLAPEDDLDLIETNLERFGFSAPVLEVPDSRIPAADGAFDVVVLNGLGRAINLARLADELFRVLKCGGKVIGLFPAYYDAGYWQDLLLPYQHLYWRRPADATTAPKTTARQLRRAFGRFTENRVVKRHLRRAELPHPARVLPLAIMERLVGRVLVLKARKPISAARVLAGWSEADSAAA